MNKTKVLFRVFRMTVYFSQLFLLRCLGNSALAGLLRRVINGLAAITVVYTIVAFLEGFPASVW